MVELVEAGSTGARGAEMTKLSSLWKPLLHQAQQPSQYYHFLLN